MFDSRILNKQVTIFTYGNIEIKGYVRAVEDDFVEILEFANSLIFVKKDDISIVKLNIEPVTNFVQVKPEQKVELPTQKVNSSEFSMNVGKIEEHPIYKNPSFSRTTERKKYDISE